MRKIIISPYSRGLSNSKNYPYWTEVISLLKGYNIIQLGLGGEPVFTGTSFMDEPLNKVEDLLMKVGIFISVDNFLPHMADYLGVRGVVLFGPSDPEIFGHSTHINLLKDRKFLRGDQYGFYMGYTWGHSQEGWVKPDEIIRAVKKVEESRG